MGRETFASASSIGKGGAAGTMMGIAHGYIEISTTQPEQVPAKMRAVAQGINQAMGSVGVGTKKAEAGISSVTSAAMGLAGALGISFGAAGVVQLARFAIATDELATSYARQSVAARSLAGSQAELNKLLEAYDVASGGAIDKATALANVTRLQAIGFADTAEELDQFVRAVRGISIATGQTQEYVSQQLTLAIANQSEMRLDQVGIGVSELKQKVAELRSENSGLTKEMAYQQAVLSIAEDKFGALANSSEAAVTGIEAVTREWKDLRLEIGQEFHPGVNNLGKWTADFIEWIRLRREEIPGEAERFAEAAGMDPKMRSATIGSRTNIGRVTPLSMANEPFVEGVNEAKLDWAKGINELNEQMYDDINEQERNYGDQRADTVRDYQQGIVREAQDFATSRLRQEQDMLRSIADLHEDAARREIRAAEDLARTIGDAQEDSAERIVDARSDTNERLAELEEDYQRNREKAARDHRDKLLDAAGRLDAKAVADAQRDFARSRKDAEEAHNDQRDDLKKQLDKRTAEERENLAERIDDANEAHARQLADARAADAERLADMKADHELRQQREDEDRAIRLARMAEDHAEQLAEMAEANSERLAQIRLHAWEERSQLDADHRAEMVALGVRNEEWIAEAEEIVDEGMRLWDKFFGHINDGLGGAIPGWMTGASQDTPPGMSSGGGTVIGGSRNSTKMTVGINIYPTANQSPYDIAATVEENLIRLLREVGE